jgi:hypothetical protein
VNEQGISRHAIGTVVPIELLGFIQLVVPHRQARSRKAHQSFGSDNGQVHFHGMKSKEFSILNFTSSVE